MIVVDTSILIDYLRSKTDKTQTHYYRLSESESDLSISSITHTELFAGSNVWKSKQALHSLELTLSGLNIITISPTISKQAGFIRANFHLSIADAIITATALENQARLATLNLKDFRKVPNLRIYTFD